MICKPSMIAAALAGGLLASTAAPAGAQDHMLAVNFEMVCLNPVQRAELPNHGRSIIIAPTDDGVYVYELRLVDRGWLLLVQRAPDEICVVGQGSKIHFPEGQPGE